MSGAAKSARAERVTDIPVTADMLARALVAAAVHLRLDPERVMDTGGAIGAKPAEARRAAAFGLSLFLGIPAYDAARLLKIAKTRQGIEASLGRGFVRGEATGPAAQSVADALNWTYRWKPDGKVHRPPFGEKKTLHPDPTTRETLHRSVPSSGQSPEGRGKRRRKRQVNGWTDSELEALRAGRAAGRKISALMRDLPGRTVGAINTKIRDLKLPPATVVRDTAGAWTDEENEILRRGRKAGDTYDVIAARLPGRAPASCRVQAQKLGLTRKRGADRKSGAAVPATVRVPESSQSTNPKAEARARGPWSDGERAALKAARLSGERWAETLARFPGRTMNGVRAEFNRLAAAEPGLMERAREANARTRAGGRGPRWTPDEDRIVTEGVTTGRPDEAIAADLKRRTPEAVRSRAKVLRIHTRPTGAEKLAEAKAAVIWTPADDAVIAEIAAKGYSADTAIARLPRHDRDLVRAELAKAERRARREAQPRGEAVSSGPAVPGATKTGPCAALSLDPKQCKWPVGDPRAPDFHFCGAARVQGAYCAGHAVMAYPPKQKRRRRAVDAEAVLASLDRKNEARARRAVWGGGE